MKKILQNLYEKIFLNKIRIKDKRLNELLIFLEKTGEHNIIKAGIVFNQVVLQVFFPYHYPQDKFRLLTDRQKEILSILEDPKIKFSNRDAQRIF